MRSADTSFWSVRVLAPRPGRDRRRRGPALALALLLTAGAGRAAPADPALGQDQPPEVVKRAGELKAVLERAGQYVVDYEQSFSNLVAEETYTQRVGPAEAPRKHRVTRADLVFVRLQGDIPWASFRDVFEVDGKPVRDRDRRLEKLFSNPQQDAAERARRLVKASAAYNIGPVKRTANLPTLPLLFLHPRNQGRFVFRLGPRKTIGNAECVELKYLEFDRPSLIHEAGRKQIDVPAEGSFWVQESRGAVVASEVRLSFDKERSAARLVTEYRAEPSLAMWVPARMEEEYQEVRTSVTTLAAEAVYSRFRRFSVSVEEHATVSGEAPRH